MIMGVIMISKKLFFLVGILNLPLFGMKNLQRVLGKSTVKSFFAPKRNIFYTSEYRGNYASLPASLKSLAPLQGESALRTRLMKNLYVHNKHDKVGELARKLFYLQETQ